MLLQVTLGPLALSCLLLMYNLISFLAKLVGDQCAYIAEILSIFVELHLDALNICVLSLALWSMDKLSQTCAVTFRESSLLPSRC